MANERERARRLIDADLHPLRHRGALAAAALGVPFLAATWGRRREPPGYLLIVAAPRCPRLVLRSTPPRAPRASRSRLRHAPRLGLAGRPLRDTDALRHALRGGGLPDAHPASGRSSNPPFYYSLLSFAAHRDAPPLVLGRPPHALRRLGADEHPDLRPRRLPEEQGGVQRGGREVRRPRSPLVRDHPLCDQPDLRPHRDDQRSPPPRPRWARSSPTRSPGSPSSSSSSASGSRCPSCPSTCGPPTPTRGPRRPSPPLFAAATKKAGFVAAIRVVLAISTVYSLTPQGGLFTIPNVLAVLALATMTLGNIAALTQKSMTRLLAYSSIAQAGYILIGFVIYSYAQGNPAFAQAGRARDDRGALPHHQPLGDEGRRLPRGGPGHTQARERQRRGLQRAGKRMPVTAFAMAIAFLALAGVPPLSGFWSKLLLFTSVLNGPTRGSRSRASSTARSAWATTGGWSSGCTSTSPTERPRGSRSRPRFALVLGVLVALIIAFGVFPGPVISFVAERRPALWALIDLPRSLARARACASRLVSLSTEKSVSSTQEGGGRALVEQRRAAPSPFSCRSRSSTGAAPGATSRHPLPLQGGRHLVLRPPVQDVVVDLVGDPQASPVLGERLELLRRRPADQSLRA